MPPASSRSVDVKSPPSLKVTVVGLVKLGAIQTTVAHGLEVAFKRAEKCGVFAFLQTVVLKKMEHAFDANKSVVNIKKRKCPRKF